MTYKIALSRKARKQLERAYQWYVKESPANADGWYNGFIDALNSLTSNPRRFGRAPESPLFPVEIRQLLYGKNRNWRALYTIRKDLVFVVSIRHAARRGITPDDLR
jgi:plasmid stabilization system protein ParE